MANIINDLLQQIYPKESFKEIIKLIQNKPQGLASLPIIPGLPLVGNLLQLVDKKPYQTFSKWAEVYGPIYSIKAGASSMVILNTTDIAKEAMTIRFSSISTRKLSKALTILTSDKCMVAMSDYNDFHKNVKRCVMSGLLGVNAQNKFRTHRETMMNNIVQKMHTFLKGNRTQPLSFRHIVQSELFGLALKQSLGKDIESPIYIEDLEIEMKRDEIFQVLVVDPMMGAIDVDWRDFFPYLKWVPNKRLDMKIGQMYIRRNAVMKSLIKEQKKRIGSGEVLESFLDYLFSETTITVDEMRMLIWEAIIESSDTTLITTEWAIYELAKNKSLQDKLFWEIRSVCGFSKITEENLPQLPYLNAVFHETLRRHSPVPVIPSRYAHEDTELGGYHIPAGSEIAINLYGCNMDKNQWEEPEKWKPERFESDIYDSTDMYKTMSFGGGKRVCAGAPQAITISCVAIGRLVQEFEWSLIEGQKEDVDTLGLTAHMLHPLQAFIRPRSS